MLCFIIIMAYRRWVSYLFRGLRRFQHCTGHIMMGGWKSRGNQHIQLVKVLHLPAFPLEVSRDWNSDLRGVR